MLLYFSPAGNLPRGLRKCIKRGKILKNLRGNILMNQLSSVKRATMTAICIALCYVLPLAFHALGGGTYFSPMHIPVLLCGLVCGPGYGLFCGLAGSLICSTTGMPNVTQLPYFLPELMTYGLMCGLMMKAIHTKHTLADVYISMIVSMITGRIIGGIAQALTVQLLGTGVVFNISIWATSYFVSAIPGIIAHLVIVPILYMTLAKAKLIPRRYDPAKNTENQKLSINP